MLSEVKPNHSMRRTDLLISTATYNLEQVHTIIATTSVLHVSFPPDPEEGPFPAILPMIGQMGSYDHPSAGLDEPMDCYIHGYVTARMMKLARSTKENGDSQGLPVTVAATKVDGKVLSLTPFTHSYNYRSAMLFGYASEVTDPEEKLWAMELITEKVMTGRWSSSRVPPDQGEMSSTTILRIKIVNGSGKARSGGPVDAKKDLEDRDSMNGFWTGVVPMWECYGEPQPSKYNGVASIPSHITEYCNEENSDAKEHAVEAAKDVSS